jgi:hypothetical protein
VDKLVDKLLGNGLISGSDCEFRPVSYPSRAVKSIAWKSMTARLKAFLFKQFLYMHGFFANITVPA